MHRYNLAAIMSAVEIRGGYMSKFDGKVAVVTGAGKGIGRASAIAFAAEGAKVIVADIDSQSGHETTAMIHQLGGEAFFIQTDISLANDVEQLIAKSVETFGRLDFAHNNAGIEGEPSKVAGTDEETFDQVIAVNLKGTWLCMKYEIEQMMKQGSGAIVNTSSVAGQVGLYNYSSYSASKHGILGLTKTAALEYTKRGIRINAVCPGAIKTDMIDRALVKDDLEESGVGKIFQNLQLRIGQAVLSRNQPARRMGLPQEVAKAVVWLCSDDASYITGHALTVDGGYLIH